MHDNHLRISPHFTLSEFQCPCCLRVRLQPELLLRLEALRGIWGPLRITSGYRCTRHNRDVGGVPGSRHLIGAAADIAVTPVEQGRFARLAKKQGFEQVIPYGARGFVHLAIRTDTA